MAELLLEILSEEIPARMQRAAAKLLLDGMSKDLSGAGIAFTATKVFVTPRRMVLFIDGLPTATPDITEERRGPRADAPQGAIDGFLKSAGVTLEQCEKRDTGKGEFLFATIMKKGVSTSEFLVDTIEDLFATFFWPKSMRFPAASFRWVRPINSVLALFDGEVLKKLDLGLIPVDKITAGHRFLAPARFQVTGFADYQNKIQAAKVRLDQDERRAHIEAQLERVAQEAGLKVKEDAGLLDEVTGLVEWPVILMGQIDESFMDLPPEVLTTAMRTHQKYFACLDANGGLAPRFLVVANIETADGGKAIVAGNERVLRARLSDAKFFWDQDRKATLESRIGKLAERTFYAGLGTVQDKSERLGELAGWLAGFTGAEPNLAKRAGRLAKADLATDMVGEFPELQGIMGRYYVLHDNRPLEVARAVAEHYAPQGPDDMCPEAPTSVAVALADKIDTLVGFFGIGEKPTGSKDPFALRRAALGIIRLILENGIRIGLRKLIAQASDLYPTGVLKTDPTPDLLSFFADRLKVYLRDKGLRHDLIDAVFAQGINGEVEDDLVRLIKRAEALDAFLKTDDGTNLLIAFRRAANILRIEEKKDGAQYGPDIDQAQLAEHEEKALYGMLAATWAGELETAIHHEKFEDAMGALAALRQPVDAFFDKVTVNAPEPKLRINRLHLLSAIVRAMRHVADFSKIEG